MNVKIFSGSTTAEALQAVRRELGPEAVVLETRRGATGIEVLAAAERPGPRTARPVITPAESPAAARLADDLAAQGFSIVFAERIAAAAQCNLDAQQLEDRAQALAYARELIAHWLPIAAPEQATARGARVLALVGPSGVGKTTTIAKLAARERLASGRTVVLASCDTRRLGGMEALAAYARVLDVPFQEVQGARDLQRGRDLAGKHGTLYLDTPGIPRHDRAALDRLSELLGALRGEEIELLLAADAEGETLSETVRRFGRLKLGAIGATRIDEALRPGTLLTALTRAGLPLRHCGCGPDVPDDLTTPTGRQLAAWALPLPGERGQIPGAEA